MDKKNIPIISAVVTQHAEEASFLSSKFLEQGYSASVPPQQWSLQ
jgi:hypothetical protein